MNLSGSRYLPILLLFTILVIFGFQIYWLGQIYHREKKALETRTALHFRESVFELQARQLDAKIEGKIKKDSSFMLITDKRVRNDAEARKAEEVIGMANVLRRKGGVVIRKQLSNDGGRTISTINVTGDDVDSNKTSFR